MTTRWLIGLMILAALLGGSSHRLGAQQFEAAGISHVPPSTDAVAAIAGSHVRAAPPSARKISRGVLIGAGVGAATGLLVAVASPHSSHADNTLGYVAGAAIGAFTGMVIGGVIGATR